jgi:hypothetical protein
LLLLVFAEFLTLAEGAAFVKPAAVDLQPRAVVGFAPVSIWAAFLSLSFQLRTTGGLHADGRQPASHEEMPLLRGGDSGKFDFYGDSSAIQGSWNASRTLVQIQLREATMFCQNCGKAIEDGVTGCPHCGQSAGVSQAVGASVAARLPRLTHPKLESGIAGFCRPVLQALEDGKVLRTLMALFLRLYAVASALGVLYLVIEIAKAALRAQDTQTTIAELIVAIIVLLFGVSAFFIFFYRAASVASLGESPFTVIPMVSILTRATGEVYAAGLVLLGVGGCLFIWFTGRSPDTILGPLGQMLSSVGFSGGPFIDGVKMLLFGVFWGFAVLLGSYFLAEFIVVIADIARNVRVLVERGEQS